MDDPNVSRSEVISHLKKAFAYHHNYKLEAMNGQAADRHMFGLFVAAKFAGVQPKLFEHKVSEVKKLKLVVLSITSQSAWSVCFWMDVGFYVWSNRIEIKSSLYSQHHADACNEWRCRIFAA